MVLAAYAERLLEGRRVVVFGDSTSGLAEHLVERGARLVHVYDADLGRVAEATTRGASQSISFAPLGEGGIAVRDGAFDIGIIENLAEADDAAGLVRRMRRALAARGIAFIAAPNPEVEARLLPEKSKAGPSYYELYDLAGAEFDEIRMLGQTPFVGYAVAEFSEDGGDEYSIDTAFVPGGAEEPEYYIALASHFPVALDSFCVVQLPAEPLLAQADSDATSQVASLKRQLAAVERKLSEAQRSEVKPDAETKRLLLEANDELARRDAWVAELESRAAIADERADDAEANFERLKLEVSRLKQALHAAKQKEVERSRAEGEDSKQQRELEQRFQRQLREQEQESQNQLQLLKQALADAQHESDDNAKKDQFAARQNEVIRRKLEAADKEVAELKRVLAEAHRELRQHSQAEEQQQEEAAKKKRQQEEQQQQRQQAAAEVETNASLSAEVEQLRAKVEDLLAQLAQNQKQLADAAEQNRDVARDVVTLETQLRERGQEVARLCVDLSKMENFGEQLLRELDEARSPSPEGDEEGSDAGDSPAISGSAPAGATAADTNDLRHKLDALAAANAQHVADLTAARWTIQELESKMQTTGADDAAVSSELQRARAEIQRQSALLQQFRDKAQL